MTAMAPVSAGFANECANDNLTTPAVKVAAIVNLFGITDVADLLQAPNMRTYAASWLGSLPGREDLATRLSPLTYVRPDGPPVLTIHGDGDATVPYSHALRLHQALTSDGVRNEQMTIHGGGHGGFTAEQDLEVFWRVLASVRSLGSWK